MKYVLSYHGFKSAISLLVCIVFVVQLTACGTIMYPERRGLTRDPAQLDIAVVAMDGVLLLFFILPGVIAYGVDFSTGCIYLPPGRIMQNMDELDPTEMQVIRVAPEHLDLATLPGIIAQHTGLSVASRSDETLIFRPDSADINIQQELTLLLNGEAPQSQGTWYAGDQIMLVTDADGRVTNMGLVVPFEVRLAEK